MTNDIYCSCEPPIRTRILHFSHQLEMEFIKYNFVKGTV